MDAILAINTSMGALGYAVDVAIIDVSIQLFSQNMQYTQVTIIILAMTEGRKTLLKWYKISIVDQITFQ